MNSGKLNTLALVVFLGIVGCSVEPDIIDSESEPGWVQNGLKADQTEWMSGDPVRLALAQVRTDLPTTDYWTLLSNGAVTEDVTGGDAQISGSLRRALVIGLNRDSKHIDGQNIRTWHYTLGANITPLRITQFLKTSILGFKLKAGTRIEYARAFESKSEADSAQALTLMDLPHDSESALKLPTGTVATIPINGRMAIDVNGVFLSRAARFSKELNPYLNTSVFGTTSGIRQGTLTIDGDIMLQVIRLSDQRVRLRVSTGSALNTKGSVNASILGSAAYNSVANVYRFIPSAMVDRARAIKTRVQKAQQVVNAAKAQKQRIALLRSKLGNRTGLLLDAFGLPKIDLGLKRIRAIANANFDWAPKLAKMTDKLETLEEAVFTKTEAVLKRVLDPWRDRFKKVSKPIRRLSSRTYNLAGSVRLGDQFGRTVRTVADYEFDLSNPEARHAFDRAISGRAVWLDAVTGWAKGSPDTVRLADLTIADSIASEDAALQYRRVIRHATTMSDIRTRHYGVKLSGLWMSTGMDWDKQANTVELTDEFGNKALWEARAWEFSTHLSWIADKNSRSFASGAFINESQSMLTDAGYWFSWNRMYAKSMSTPVAEALGEMINLLGPTGIKVGIPALYDGEHKGRVSAELDVVYSKKAMDVIFDPTHTNDSLLWEVFGDVAEHFDNSFGLPPAIAPIRPKILDSIEGGHEACEKVADNFGGGYCFYFAHEFVPALRKAQQSSDPQARLNFLEKFYKAGPFGNPIGSRLLVRYVATLIDYLGMGHEISIRASIRNNEDSSEAASPSLETGNPESFALIETMGADGLR